VSIYRDTESLDARSKRNKMRTTLSILYALFICAALTQVALGRQQPRHGPRTTAPQETLHMLDVEIDDLATYLGGYPPQLKDNAERQSVTAKWRRAIKKFGTLLQQYPDEAEIMWRMGVLYHMGHNLDIKGAWQQAERHLKRALTVNPQSVDAHMRLGFLYVNTHPRYAAAAESAFKEALALAKDTSLADAHLGLTFAYYYQAQFQDAVREAEAYLALYPDNAAMKNLRDIALERAKKAGQ
jgi:tetratricopeptide (TPR) repeat protein